MTYSRDWSESTPIDHTKFNVQPGAVRDAKTDVAERLQTMFYGFIAGETETGAKYLEYKDQGSDPSAPAATYSRIYFKSGSLYIRNATAIYQISQGGVLSFVKAADVASATTTDIGAALGQFLDITGTTTITGLGTVAAGIQRDVRFTGILTLTHNATSLILPTSANITTANGDTAKFVSLGSGNWKCLSYQKVDGTPLLSGFTPTAANALSGSVIQSVSSEDGTYSTGLGGWAADNTIPQNTEGREVLTLAITPKRSDSFLEIECNLFGVGGNAIFKGAVFVDSTADAIVCGSVGSSIAVILNLCIKKRVSSGNTSARTYKVRVGDISNADTVYFNGNVGGAVYNGTLISSIKINEIAP